MTTYKQMKQALLSNNTVEMYKPTARLIQMVTILACAGIVSIVTNGTDWRVTLVRKATVYPKATVADVEAQPTLAVVPSDYAHIRLADKVRYVDGVRIVRKQYSGKAYPVVRYTDNCVLLDTGYGIIGRLRENVLYAAEYAAYVGGLNAVAEQAA